MGLHFWSPLWIFKKSKKNFKFFEKNFIVKKCAYRPKMKPHQVLGQYLEVYGQLSPITPEARKKKAPLFHTELKRNEDFLKAVYILAFYFRWGTSISFMVTSSSNALQRYLLCIGNPMKNQFKAQDLMPTLLLCQKVEAELLVS